MKSGYAYYENTFTRKPAYLVIVKKAKPLPAMAAAFAGSYGKHRIGLGKVS